MRPWYSLSGPTTSAAYNTMHAERTALALQNPATLPQYSDCSGGTTRSYPVPVCPPGEPCVAVGRAPAECSPTGKWYSPDHQEFCCKITAATRLQLLSFKWRDAYEGLQRETQNFVEAWCPHCKTPFESCPECIRPDDTKLKKSVSNLRLLVEEMKPYADLSGSILRAQETIAQAERILSWVEFGVPPRSQAVVQQLVQEESTPFYLHPAFLIGVGGAALYFLLRRG